MIIPVKKTLNSAGHIDAKLIDFSEICQKNPAKSAVFYWLFLGEVSPRNFPWNRPIFLRICPWKSFEIWLFSAKIPRNRPIFLRILTFLPRKSREIGRLFREFWLFSRENPAKSADFSANLPLKIPRNFAFFSAKYQKPWTIKTVRKEPLWHWCGWGGHVELSFVKQNVLQRRISKLEMNLPTADKIKQRGLKKLVPWNHNIIFD